MQTIELFLGNSIALAGALLHPRTVEDTDRATRVVDKPSPFERVGRVRYARTPHPEHHGEKLLGERETVRMHSILSHEKPATTPLFQKMKCIASSRLGDLIEECVRVAEHHPLHHDAPLQFRSKNARFHFQAGAAHLHIDTRGRFLVAE